MKRKLECQEIIRLMIKSELSFSLLYKKYSQLFPNKDFWLQLAKEEVVHAEWLKALYESRDVKEMKDHLFPVESLKLILDSIEEDLRSADKKTSEEALSIALMYEKSMVEREYFDIFRSDSDQLISVLKKLEKETEGHISKIEEEIKSLNVRA